MMRGTIARRYTHTHPDRDPLSLAVAAVAHWLSNQRLDLQFTLAAKPPDAA